MEKLSLTLTHNILSRLPLVSIFNCKQVCKTWHALVTHPSLSYLHHAYHESYNNPCLFLHSAHSNGDQLYLVDNFSYVHDNLRSYKALVKEISLPLDDHKLTSVLHCDGELTELPPRPLTPEYKVVSGFGFHPMSKERKVVKIVEHECIKYNSRLRNCELSLEQSIEVFNLGSSFWRVKGNNPFQIRMQSCEVLVNGALHWLGQAKVTESQIIVSFDLMQEEFCQISLPNIRIGGPDSSRFAALGGCLSVVSRMGMNKIYVWLIKDYGIKESWTKELTI
ncbi:hypothetical protein CRYUN_Cryun23aG0043000 [Craigia yunnanensis]